MILFFALIFLGAAIYFARQALISALYEALVRESLRREVEREIQKHEKRRNDVMFFKHEDIWEKEAV